MMARPAITLRSLAVALPVVFVLHVLEEAPGFVSWFNRHVDPDITSRLFFSVNATAVQGGYAPGVVSGTLLYLPFSLVFIGVVARDCRLPLPLAAGVTLLGGLPMYIHGWLIVFRGSRLF